METKRVILKCEVVTPMYISGTDQSICELRAPSIKGMVRFWWRAASAHLGDKLATEEQEIFGGAGSDREDKKAGRSKVSIRVLLNEKKDPTISSLAIDPVKYCGTAYLLYSVVSIKKRPYIKPGTSFEIILSYKEKKYIEEFLKGFMYLEYFGAVGTRNRRGAGSFMVKQVTGGEGLKYADLLDLSPITERAALVDRITQIKTYIGDARVKNYSILRGSEVYIFNNKDDWQDALEYIGNPFRAFRSQYNDQLYRTPSFGFPIRHRHTGATFIAEGYGNKLQRRESPLIFKILEAGSNKYFPMIIYLGGEFLPEGYVIEEKRGGDPHKPDTSIIDEFLGTVIPNSEVVKI